MKSSQRVAKNTLFGLLGGVLGGGLQFFSLLIVARHLEVKDFGIFSYLLAFATIFQYLADFGLSRMLIREMALRPADLDSLLGHAKGLVWALFGLALGLALAVILVLPIPAHLKMLTWLMCLGSLTQLHIISYASVLRATENMEFNSLAFTLHKVVLVVLLWLVLGLSWGLPGVIFAYFAANLALWLYYHLVVTIGFTPGRVRYDWLLWRALLTDSLSMAGSLFLRQFTWQMDLLLLGVLAGPVALGYFSGPFRFLMGLMLVATLFTQPLFPLFVRLARESPVEFAVAYQRTLKWFGVLSVPLMVVCVALPQKCLLLFFGPQFNPAAGALAILGWAVLPIFISVLHPYLFSVVQRQWNYFFLLLVAVVVRFLLEITLVRRFGYLGESIIVVGTELVLFATVTWRLSRLGLAPALAQTLGKPLLAGAPCLILLICTPHDTWLQAALSVTFCLALYPLMLWWCRSLTPQEAALVGEGLRFGKPYWHRIRAMVSGRDIPI